MIDPTFVELSRWQFAATALYHFLFVPLTLELSWLLVIMETVYVMTGKEIYKDMTKFWGKLFGINFALGVTTGLTMEFQFGTNWSYYSHYVGDVFGAPLAIEGLMAFFLEVDLHRPVLPGMGQTVEAAASGGDVPHRDRLQSVGAVDPDRQWLDAEPDRRGVLPRNHAHGDDQLRRGVPEPGGAGQIRSYRRRRLRHGVGIRAGHFSLVHPEGPRSGIVWRRRLAGLLDAVLHGIANGRRRRRRRRSSVSGFPEHPPTTGATKISACGDKSAEAADRVADMRAVRRFWKTGRSARRCRTVKAEDVAWPPVRSMARAPGIRCRARGGGCDSISAAASSGCERRGCTSPAQRQASWA